MGIKGNMRRKYRILNSKIKKDLCSFFSCYLPLYGLGNISAKNDSVFFEKLFTLRLKRKVGISLHGAKVPDT